MDDGTIVVSEAVPIQGLVDQLRGVERTFVPDRASRFEGMPSRFKVLPESRSLKNVVETVRVMTGVVAGGFDPGNAVFWKFRSGDYLLPTAWIQAANAPALHILMLTTSAEDALNVSHESGAEYFNMEAGRIVSVRQSCRFWLGPISADGLHLAISGLATDETGGARV